MLKRKLGLLVAAAVMVGMLSSCVVNVNDDKKNGGNGSGSGIDYKDYTGADRSITIRNNSSKNVVCFKGAPDKELSNLISGARGSTTTGLRMDTSLFKKTGDFVLYVFTEEDYTAYKNDVDELKNHTFAMIYAFYNEDSESNSNLVYEISSSAGGSCYILINNMTKYNVEMRKNSIYGESIAFAGHDTIQTKICLEPDNYNIFPVFRKFSKANGEIVTVFPKDADGNPVFKGFSLGTGNETAEFAVSSWFNPADFQTTTVPGSAYISIKNGADTGVCLYKGADAEATVTSTGGKYINANGNSLVFEVPMVPTGGKSFASSEKITNWRIGSPVSASNVGIIETADLEAGYMYFIDVSGTAYKPVATWRKSGDDFVKSKIEYDDEDSY